MAKGKKKQASGDYRYVPPPGGEPTAADRRKAALVKRAQAAHKKLGGEAEPLIAQVEKVDAFSKLSKANQAILRKAEGK